MSIAQNCDDVPDVELVSTAIVAETFGFGRRTIRRWAAQKQIVPDLITPGGHMRWDLDKLRRQLEPAARQVRAPAASGSNTRNAKLSSR